MRAMTSALVFIGLIGIVAGSVPARAHDFDEDEGAHHGRWREHQWHEQRWREHEWREQARERYAPPREAYAPQGYYVGQPTYLAPPAYVSRPSYYTPPYHYSPPSYYAPPAYDAPPAYYQPPAQPYYSSPNVTIGIEFGLR